MSPKIAEKGLLQALLWKVLSQENVIAKIHGLLCPVASIPKQNVPR